jgi:hypothetical protein
MAMQVTCKRPTGAMLYWTVDGWKAELAFQEKRGRKDSNGNEVGYDTVYHERPMVIFVLDPCCNYIAGYAIGRKETPALITEAMRNAYRHVKELFGARYRVYQTQSDNYGKGCLKPMYTEASNIYTPAERGNAKSKAVERFNHWFNMEYLRYFDNWTGHGVKAKETNQPNGEFKELIKKNYPDEAGCYLQIENAIAEDRAKKIDAYRAAWAKTREEHKELLSDEMYLYLFGTATGHRSKHQPDGLRVTIGGEQFKFECFDRRFREHGAVRWEVKYDPADLSQALAVNEDETLRFMLEQKYVQPMALAERSEGDAAQLRRVFDFKDEMRLEVIDKQAKAADIREAMIRQNREEIENDTLLKFMITDSRGQHKDRLAEMYAPAGRAKAKVVEAVVVEDDDDYEEVIFDEREERIRAYR